MKKLIFASLFWVSFAQAQSSSVSASSVSPAANEASISTSTTTLEKAGENRKYKDDHTLTDAKLRADDGSLSKWSMKGSLSYMGPTLGDLSAADQPNPDGSIGNYSQRITGSVSGKYRISPTQTFSMGTGLAFNHPFHGMDRTDVNNPFFSYDFANRFGPLQMRNSPGFLIATIPNYTATGEFGGVNWDNSLVYNLGASGFALSLDTKFNWWLYNRAYRAGSIKAGGDGMAEEYTIGTYPGVKYSFSDALNVYTSLGFKWFNPRQLADKSALWNRTVTWQLGLGYAIGRDIYFAPNLQTYPGILTANSTTVNMSTIFSLL